MEKELDVVGVRIPMVDAAAKATGAAQFTDDLILSGMLYGRILRSPFRMHGFSISTLQGPRGSLE